MVGTLENSTHRNINIIMYINLISVPIEKGLSVELPQEDDIEK